MLTSNLLRIQSRPSLNSVTSVESDFVSKSSFRRTGDASSIGIATKGFLKGVAEPVTSLRKFFLI